ncbi:MAG TPA: ribonuclease III [Anaeromyxobacteraceae bacterium]|nr:ribonuclease III [Anaeromyxobacteraceae bacterium]
MRLGCSLPDAAIALAALTHKSYVNEHRSQLLSDNERLEFLGDAVIDLAVAHRLMERFPDAREGDLSKLRAAVVDEAGLAKMAREIGIGPLLRLGRGEELTGGREKASLLADAMEAVVAAVYLTGGLEPVLRLIDRFLGDAFARATAGTLDRDFKTQFQELAQSRLRSTPRYRVVAEHGPDHSKTFEVELELRGEVVGRGSGRSKKDAEQSAARGALETVNGRFGVEPRALQVSPAPSPTPTTTGTPAEADAVVSLEAVEHARIVEHGEHVDSAEAAMPDAAPEAPAEVAETGTLETPSTATETPQTTLDRPAKAAASASAKRRAVATRRRAAAPSATKAKKRTAPSGKARPARAKRAPRAKR